MSAGSIRIQGEQSVACSFVFGVQYAKRPRNLFVRFASACYVYFDVPAVTVTRWLKAHEGGSYFRRNIRDRFEYERIPDELYQSLHTQPQ
jgi:hypothetical protein